MGREIELIQRHKAESDLAVAAASILCALSIFAHIAGAAIGSRLRASKDVSPAQHDGDDGEAEVDSGLLQPMEAQASDFAPTTQLSQQQPLNRKPILYAVGIGASLSAVVASVVLTLVMWDDLAIVNVLFGACSDAVIGGLVGFWLSSFFQVARNAIAEAQEDK